jgi:hypothetical protein
LVRPDTTHSFRKAGLSGIVAGLPVIGGLGSGADDLNIQSIIHSATWVALRLATLDFHLHGWFFFWFTWQISNMDGPFIQSFFIPKG